VTDSPLGELHPQWYGDRFEPHCLSRFFDDDDWFGRYLSPTQMQEVMDSTSYEEFFLALEDGPHDIIPGGIRGDFTTFTAPNGEFSFRVPLFQWKIEWLTVITRSYFLSTPFAARPSLVAVADA
jgi:hypothetical protein